MAQEHYLSEEFLADVGLEKDAVINLKKAFDAFDHDKVGAISVETTGTIFRIFGIKLSHEGLMEIIEDIDEDRNGTLEFEEFVLLSSRFLVEEDEEALKKELKEAFRIYDKGHNGYITTKTLKEILHELDQKLTKEEVDEMIDEIDQDHSGTVDFDEFMEMMTG